MKLKLNIFSPRNRKSIPKSWCGTWIDETGRKLHIESTKHDFYLATIRDKNNTAYKIELLVEQVKETVNLMAQFIEDVHKNPCLQIEAGIHDIGPTYKLYFLLKKENGDVRLAKNSDKLENLIIRPDVGIGLYDDLEDDLGVPWAFPLSDYKKHIE
ncbi:hypothetical protein [Marinifilum fragile]|uniref:hypothetical protein n=1 Tax=Marinifilum fragile TaxID=570161 RepID=UPI0006D1D146|nr:hypothetical protein [Marinifilum fragile]